MPKSVITPLIKTLFSGYIGEGPIVKQFSKSLSDYIGNPFVLTLNSGTSALHLALQLAGVKPGDQVISTPLTCTATNWSILAQGADIVWADIDLDTGNIDPDSIEQKITSKTAAVMTVDWGGQPVDIDAIKEIAGKIPVIDDAAHAFGANYKGKKVGVQADFTCFSFMAIKTPTTIDGGLLCVKDRKNYKRGALLRWYGIDRSKPDRNNRIEEDIYEWGYKFHMNDVAATIGLEQLKYAEKSISRCRENAAFYFQELKNVPGLKLLQLPQNSRSSFWLFTVRVQNRDKFKSMMIKNGIAVSQVHRRNDTHPVVAKYKTDLPHLDIFSQEMICIPVGWWVKDTDRKYIVETIKKGW